MKVSCIIPVYNEAERAPAVIDAILKCKLVDEVVVVNDGSTDKTKEVLEKINGINFISLEKNHGKSYAVITALKLTKNELVMMIDSDLIGLSPEDVSALIEPVIQNKADVTMSIRDNSLLVYKLFGCDFFSGERVFYKSILGDFNQMQKLKGFLLESFINQIIIAKKLRIKNIKWNGVITPRKSVKYGFWKGSYEDLKMFKLIFFFLGFLGSIKMFFQMLRLKV